MALTFRTQQSIAAGIPAGETIQGVATDGNKIYVRTSGNFGRNVKRFALDGSYEPDGDNRIILNFTGLPGTPHGNPEIIGFSHRGNNFYVMYVQPLAGGQFNWGVQSLNPNTFRGGASLFNRSIASHSITDFDIDGTYVYYLVPSSNAVNRITISGGANASTLTGLAADIRNIAVSSNRLLAIRANDIQAYTLAGVSVNGDDVILPGDLGNSLGAGYIGGNLYLVDNNLDLYTFGEILLDGTYTGNFGGLSLHANFLVDDTNVHVVHNNVIQDFALTRRGGNPLAFTRNAARDVTLTGHPTSIVTWGFTESHFGSHDGEWVILTRERNMALGTIGKVRVYNHTGTQKVLEFDIPSVVPGINTAATAMRAPKTVSEFYGYYLVRVVRGETGNMRFLVFDQNGNIRPDLTITLQSASPSTLRDAATETNTPLYIASRGTPVGTAVAFHPGTGEELMGERVAASELAQVDGISIYRNSLYAATLTSITKYDNVPTIPNPFASGGGGLNFGLFQTIVTNAFMENNMNRRNRR